MSRPCAASALRARQHREGVFLADAVEVRDGFQHGVSSSRVSVGSGIAASGGDQLGRVLVVQPADLHLGHAHDLEDDRDRPADQQQPVERRDRPDQPLALRRHGIAVAERGVVLEGEFERLAVRGETPSKS